MQARHVHRRLSALATGLCLLLFLALGSGGLLDAREAPKGGKEVERYPPSFRLAVQEAIDAGVVRLRALQTPDGRWGETGHEQAMGHTALPLLAMLKAGVPRDDPQVGRAFTALRKMKIRMVYSVAAYMMAIHAGYEPALDVLDSDVDKKRSARAKPADVRGRLSEEDLATIRAGRDYLLEARRANGLWHYDLPAGDTRGKHDLSNSQYALLGLRAAMDCGVKVPPKAWRKALNTLLAHQDAEGPKVRLADHRIRGKYAFESTVRAQARGFHYTLHRRKDPETGAPGWHYPATGSMTTAGVAAVAICAEGLWRSRKFKGADRKKSKEALRDGLAWMQENFAVDKNPGHGNLRHHLYYLYGLERMGMLVSRRWIGERDWYREGADHFLKAQDERGSWGTHVDTAFGILFLKRATRATDRVVTTD